MAAEGDEEKFDNYVFGDWLVSYLIEAKPSDVIGEQDFLTIVGELKTWVVEHFSADEKEYLIEKLASLVEFSSETAKQAAFELIAALKEK